MCTRQNERVARKTVIIATAVAMILTAYGCSFGRPRPPKRSFTPEDLLIDSDIMPSGWELADPTFPAGDDLCTDESAAIRFSVTNESQSMRGGTHSVYRYLSQDIAQRTFKVKCLAHTRILDQVNEWTYQSPVAEQSHFGCHNMAGNAGLACEWAAQYEEYIVVFGVAMSPGEVSPTNIEQIEYIVKAIDERMTLYLELSTPTPSDQ